MYNFVKHDKLEATVRHEFFHVNQPCEVVVFIYMGEFVLKLLINQIILEICFCEVTSTLLKGHSQLAHMHTRYHFIANFHITETRSILPLTKYDEIIS